MRHRPPRSLRTELLVNLGFVTSAAVILVGLTTVILAGGDLRETLEPLLILWLGSTVVFVLFGAYVVRRLVITPLQRLSAEADTIAEGRLDESPAGYETAELTHLSGRYRAMAKSLLDAQSQMVRVEKLAGIGSLAAGVAHEVRNPLGALSTYVDVLHRRGTDHEVTEAMRGAIERIERTVQSLLRYARPGVAVGVVKLNEAVRASLEFLEAQGLLSGLALTVELEPDLPPVRGDRHLLEQVVVNLVVNACQAAPRGTLVVGTTRERFESRQPSGSRVRGGESAPDRNGDRSRIWSSRPRRPDVAPGTPGVLLYVADDGPGVPEKDRERVFDPFYTTKDPGQGTGLGLAIVARTVHDAGGTVWVDRAREGGAVFKVFIPIALQPGSAAGEPSYATADR
ncbi:MAG TPA: ATP-binding protein [Gemmatimonadales bacterium]|jgi:two-component system NtrC family sensor kinase|nr:ATP-binding protein [Gemmatimonadales bacterium]